MAVRAEEGASGSDRRRRRHGSEGGVRGRCPLCEGAARWLAHRMSALLQLGVSWGCRPGGSTCSRFYCASTPHRRRVLSASEEDRWRAQAKSVSRSI